METLIPEKTMRFHVPNITDWEQLYEMTKQVENEFAVSASSREYDFEKGDFDHTTCMEVMVGMREVRLERDHGYDRHLCELIINYIAENFGGELIGGLHKYGEIWFEPEKYKRLIDPKRWDKVCGWSADALSGGEPVEVTDKYGDVVGYYKPIYSDRYGDGFQMFDAEMTKLGTTFGYKKDVINYLKLHTII